MRTVHVNLGPRSYDIRFADAGHTFSEFLRGAVPKLRLVLLVADTNTVRHLETIEDALGTGVRSARVVVPAGETSKSFAELTVLLDALAQLPADRQTVVLAVGGGVVGDLGGFAAAIYNRGLPLIMVPTSLLAMVDSSVGGKTGINHPTGKNLIGAFHQPAGVWIDPRFLDTLPDREFRSGLAEVVKYGVILDAEFFAWLEAHTSEILARDAAAVRHLVARSCRLKADVVEQDEREETGVRACLNYGHTFGHAFEAVGGYGGWLHGEAVAAGMACASRLAERLGRIPPEVTRRQTDLLTAWSLPTRPDPSWAIEPQLAAMSRDKKNVGGKLRFVLPTRLGHVELVDGVPDAEVRAVLATS